MMKYLAIFLAMVPCVAHAFTFDGDVPTVIRNQITNDLGFMTSIQGNGATPMHLHVFGQVNGGNYQKFFESRVTAVGMDDCGSAKAVACVIPFRGSSKIWLTQNYVKFDHPTVAKMMIVYHESRHTEVRAGNWPHANCPVPFLDSSGHDMVSIWTGATLAGEPACDVTPFGSYGSSLILLKNIQKFCTNCTDKVRTDAGLYADNQMGRIIDPKAISAMRTDMYGATMESFQRGPRYRRYRPSMFSPQL